MCHNDQHVFQWQYLEGIGLELVGLETAPLLPPSGTTCLCKRLVATVHGQTANRLELEALEAAFQ